MSRKLAEGQRVLVAGTSYASERPVLKRPADLERRDWLRYKKPLRYDYVHRSKRRVRESDRHAQIEVESINALFQRAI